MRRYNSERAAEGDDGDGLTNRIVTTGTGKGSNESSDTE